MLGYVRSNRMSSAVVFGGIATIVVALTWVRVFPELALVDEVESLAYVAPDPAA